MNVKNFCVTIVKSAFLLILSTILGLLLLMLAYSLPVNPEKAESTLTFQWNMGWSPKASNRYEQFISHFDSFEPDVLDDATDVLILSRSLDDRNQNLLKKSLEMQEYGRYWHGYVLFLRPIFYFVDLWDFILLNGMLQVSIVMMLAILVYKQTSLIRYPLAVLSSYLLLVPTALAFSLQFTPIFYMAFLGSLFAVSAKKILRQKDYLYLFFLFMGIITCYFDFLTYPLLTWAFPLCWYLVVSGEEIPLIRNLLRVIATAVSWICGYVGMFLSKWLLLYLVCGPETYADSNTVHAFDHIHVLPDILKVRKETYTRFDAIYTNWRHYLHMVFCIIILSWLLWTIYKKLRYRWNIKRNSIPFLLISFSGPAWFFVFSHHTALHHFFTYRTFDASILATILFVSGSVPAPVKAVKSSGSSQPAAGSPQSLSRKWNAKAALSLFICIAVGWASTALAKENIGAFYGGDYQIKSFSSGDVYTSDFHATFKDIRQFGICVQTREDLNGTLHVKIYDDTTSYETSIPIEEFSSGNYATRYVEWKFDTTKEYKMELGLDGNESGIDLLFTHDGHLPLNEYKNSCLNGDSLGEVQPLGGVVYNVAVRSRLTRLYLSLLVGCYLWLLGDTLLRLRKETSPVSSVTTVPGAD